MSIAVQTEVRGRLGKQSAQQHFPVGTIRVSELLSALSYALDLTEGRPMGHSVRACILDMRIAQEWKLPGEDLADLYYTLLLKDAGCSSNSSRLYHILNADDL